MADDNLRNMHRMKKIILTLALVSSVIGVDAQTAVEPMQKINPAGRIILHNFRNRHLNPNPTPWEQNINGTQESDDVTISCVVILEKGCDSSVLSSIKDVEVKSELGDVLVISCPLSVIEKIAALPQVVQIGFGDEKRPMLDYARPASMVTDVQDGFTYEGTSRSFDGTGVVCGMMDTGLEANHINFKNTDGTSRIKRLWHMNSSDGSSVAYTDQTIGNFTTDNTSQGHATHVAGILGGGYKGNGNFYKVASANGSSGTMQSGQPIPYYGVATGADLAFAVGSLSTPNIIQGVTNIMDYASSVGKPVVVNLSLGSNLGPHDGSDYYSRALASLGEKGIICMSAGNEGDEQLSIVKELQASGNNAYLRTIPISTYSDGSFAYGRTVGIVDLWTNGSTPVSVSLKAYNGDFGTAVEVMKIDAAGTVSSSSSSTFSTYFTGSISMTAAVDYNNNRYNVYMEFNNVALASSNTSRYLMLEVTGDAGTKLYVYGNGVIFENRMTADGSTPIGLTKGSAVCSINDGCCGSNVLSVGAYTTRTTWGRLTGSIYQYTGSDFTVGQISPFSSYGSNYQGQQLPLVCAPGANIISSYSSYYAGSTASTTMSADATVDGKTYYWGAMQGTSMSCPYVSGTIGLWLQADPSLTYDKVLDVINETSTYTQLTMGGATAKPRWGAGKIDALKGIQKVLAERVSAVGDVWADDDQRLIVTDNGGGQLEVFVAGGEQMDVTLYDIQGRPVASAKADNGEAVINASQLQKGLYILRVAGKDFSLSRKIMR